MTCIRRPHSVWTTCPCEPCTKDRNRMAKLARNGAYKRVPSAQAAATLDRLRHRGWTVHAIASATGLSHRTVDRSHTATSIGPTTARAIVNHGDPTAGSVGAHGTMRRLRGLSRQGYNLQQIADDTGINFSTLAAIRQGTTQRVRSAFYTTIRDYATAREMTTGGSAPARLHAARNRWDSLLAWDDLDDPDATPEGTSPYRNEKKRRAA